MLLEIVFLASGFGILLNILSIIVLLFLQTVAGSRIWGYSELEVTSLRKEFTWTNVSKFKRSPLKSLKRKTVLLASLDNFSDKSLRYRQWNVEISIHEFLLIRSTIKLLFLSRIVSLHVDSLDVAF